MFCQALARDLPLRATTLLRRPPAAFIFSILHRRPHIIMSASLSVQEYIDKHDLSKKVEEAINQTVKVKPDEPLSYMVRLSAPNLLVTAILPFSLLDFRIGDVVLGT
jgi:hypothetical protein